MVAGCVGFALAAGRIQADPPPDQSEVRKSSIEIAAAESSNMTLVESLIDDAMADGTIGADERSLILGQARRRLSPAEVVAVEARLSSIPATRANSAAAQSGAGDSQAAQPSGAPLADAKACCDEPGCGGHWDNMILFSAVDGWAGPIDDDDGNNFGIRFGFNLGVPLSECRGIGFQAGMSYGSYNFHGRDAGNEQSSIEEQWFFTTGIFKRADLCADCPDRVSWGIVYDHLITDNLGEEGWEVGLGQFRWQVGYALSTCDEVGLMGSFRATDDEVDGRSNNEQSVSAIDQASVYWHHKWVWGADTTAYTGITEDVGEWIFGAKGEVPISNCVTLFGGAHYILPSTSGGSDNDEFANEIWNVSVGFAYYPGGNAVSKTVAGRRWMPLQSVADNGNFALDIAPSKL